MIVKVLADNRSLSPEFKTEHGLSVYLETEKYRILLDTGASDLFLQNAEKLNVDISQVDYVFISHGHADHLGGLPYFLEINSKAKVLISNNALHQEFFSRRKGLHSISTHFDFSGYRDRFVYIEKDYRLNDEIYIFATLSSLFPQPIGNKNLLKKDQNGELVPDDFNHELFFSLINKNSFVYTGCAHHGILNIVSDFQSKTHKSPDWVLGGFHLPDSTPEMQFETTHQIREITTKLINNFGKTHFFTGHCTGDKAFEQIETYSTNQIELFSCGKTIELN